MYREVPNKPKMGKYGIVMCPKGGSRKVSQNVKKWSYRGLQRELDTERVREK